MFIIMVALFIINFNRQQIKKHTDKIEENEKNNNSNKEKPLNEQATFSREEKQ